jgi:hypothetical protein
MSVEENQNGQAPGQSPAEGAKSAESPNAPIQPQGQEAAQGAVNTQAEAVPFHERPEAKDYLDRQRKKWERDAERSWSEKLARQQADFDAKLSKLSQNGQGRPKSDEQRRAILEAAQYFAEDPEARKLLGLDSVAELKQKYEETEFNRTREALDGELSTIVDKYAADYGYDKGDLRAELESFISNDVLWSQMSMSKGLIQKAARDFFSDKQADLAERAANLKLINEQKSKRGLASTKPANTAKQELPPPKNAREFFKRLRDEEARGATIG